MGFEGFAQMEGHRESEPASDRVVSMPKSDSKVGSLCCLCWF